MPEYVELGSLSRTVQLLKKTATQNHLRFGVIAGAIQNYQTSLRTTADERKVIRWQYWIGRC